MYNVHVQLKLCKLVRIHGTCTCTCNITCTCTCNITCTCTCIQLMDSITNVVIGVDVTIRFQYAYNYTYFIPT